MIDQEKDISSDSIGLVLSGGGSRSAYQVGALKAIFKYLSEHNSKISILVGSSIGAVNSIVLGGCLNRGSEQAIEILESVWRERTYSNTFGGSPTKAFLKAIQVAIFRYSAPGPTQTSLAIFDPTPLQRRVDAILEENKAADGFLGKDLQAVAVMATVEGKERKSLLFACAKNKIDDQYLSGASFNVSYVDKLTAAHGLASAALPSVLPPVHLNVESKQVRLVDGGISDNTPVDPALRLGANRIITIDTSGRRWWFDKYQQPYYSRPTWEIPAIEQTFCLCPYEYFHILNNSGMGEVLKQTAARSTRDFIIALGATWPIFKILKHKMGEMLAYEVMSYVALHPGYVEALIELGYKETMEKINSGNFWTDNQKQDDPLRKSA